MTCYFCQEKTVTKLFFKFFNKTSVFLVILRGRASPVQYVELPRVDGVFFRSQQSLVHTSSLLSPKLKGVKTQNLWGKIKHREFGQNSKMTFEILLFCSPFFLSFCLLVYRFFSKFFTAFHSISSFLSFFIENVKCCLKCLHCNATDRRCRARLDTIN